MDEIAAEDLKGLRLLKSFNKALDRVVNRQGRQVSDEDSESRRHAEYLGLYLFGLLNPSIRSMRAA